MLTQVARFEFRFQLKNPVFWVAAGIFFLLTFGAMTIDDIQIGSGGNVHANSPFAILQKHLILVLFYMFVTTAFVANVVVRDDETGFGSMVRSTRISKVDYLIGRFTGAFLAAAAAFITVPLAMWLGSLMPWLDQETLGPNRWSYYIFSYFVMALPGIFLTSAIFFALATVLRSMMATYLGVIAFLVIYFVTLGLAEDQPQLRETVALLEPFGMGAVGEITRYWTPAERNSLLPPLDGILLWNRLIWIGIGLLCLALAVLGYRFADKGQTRRGRRRRLMQQATEAPVHLPPPGSLPSARFDGSATRAQLWAQTRLEMRQVFRSPAFAVLMALGLVNACVGLWFGGDMFGTPTYPVTFSLIPILAGTFSLIPVIIAIYYAGELVWRERDRRTHEIIDSTPLPNWAYVVPKTLSVALVLLSAVAVSIIAAVLVQLLKGYGNPELDKYLLWYLVPLGVDMILLAALAVFVQALSPNKYVGWGVMVLYIIAQIVFSNIGLEHNLYLYGGTPQMPLSDINGIGMFWKGPLWFRIYWGAVAVLLLLAAHLLWRRGTETRLMPRLKRAPARLRGTPGLIGAAAAIVALLSGIWIFYNTNMLNDYRTSDALAQYQADYEKKFLKYETLPQPTITHVKLAVALHPYDKRADVKGRYVLTNLTEQAIETVHVRDADLQMELLAVDFPGAGLASRDEGFGYSIYRLDRPMAPGETRELSFTTRRWQRGFRNSGDDTRLVRNGTFLNNMEIAPAIGMDRSGLLQDRSTRRKYGLPPELRPAKLENLSATRKSYFGGGWSTADITIATVADQTPIAPGKKVSDVTRNGRRIARFVSDAPILTFFSIQSADYAERHRMHDGVDLAVFYHPAHAWNVDRMLDALQASLDYYQANFGPYQFDQARIIEFPGYASFAQAFANTMPYSESIGFIADNSDPEEIDYVTYVTAHELAHQYWAHQLIGADMQGGTMLSETLAQYSALMVMKKLYGEDKIRRFLKYELDNYLSSRGGEAIEELPLARVEDQPYIHYRKGSLVMYLLQQRLGEEAVNRALRSMLERYRFKGAPYPRSIELVRAFRAEADTPEEQRLITDLFEKITVYDLKVEEPTAVRRADGKWLVSVPVSTKKFYADGTGEEAPAVFAEPVEIGLFAAEPGRGSFDRKDVILMQQVRVRANPQVFQFVTDRKPTHAGIDPYNFFIDRNSEDNVSPVE